MNPVNTASENAVVYRICLPLSLSLFLLLSLSRSPQKERRFKGAPPRFLGPGDFLTLCIRSPAKCGRQHLVDGKDSC